MTTDPTKAPESGVDSGDGSPSEVASRLSSAVDLTPGTIGNEAPDTGSAPELEEQEPGAEAAPPEPEPVDLDALSAKARQADDYLALAQRTKADFENYRK